MKSITTFSIILLISISPNIQAQDTIIEYNNYKWKIGGKFILEQTSVRYNFVDKLGVKNFGVSLKRKLGNNLHFETGIYKITRASDQHFFISYYGQYPRSGSIPYYYHHLSLPINFSYETRLFYFTSGPYIEYLIHETSDLNTSTNEIIIEIPFPINERKINFGINLNIGLEKSINKYLNFLVEGRASHNLLNTQENNSNNFKFKNYGLAVGINYKFLN